VYTFDLRSLCRSALARVRKRGEQDGDPLLRLRMSERRVEACERRVTQDVDRAATRSAAAFIPNSRRKVDASAHCGVWA
jgi:hypothetical protein